MRDKSYHEMWWLNEFMRYKNICARAQSLLLVPLSLNMLPFQVLWYQLCHYPIWVIALDLFHSLY